MPDMYGLKRDDSIILSIDRDLTTIGRHTSNNIVINALPVSRHHSCIVRIDGRYFIKDKSTVNGTFIKKHRLLPDRETLLKVGDSIGIGAKAGENSKCTFEVVLIQFESTNVTLPSQEETPSMVDSSTDDNQNYDQVHTKEKVGSPPHEAWAKKTPKGSTSIVTMHQAVSDAREKTNQNLLGNTSHISSSELASSSKDAITNIESKVEPVVQTITAAVTVTGSLPTVITKAMHKLSSLESEIGTTQDFSEDVRVVKEEQGIHIKKHPKEEMIIDLCDDEDHEDHNNGGSQKEDDVLLVVEEDIVPATEAVDVKPLFKAGIHGSIVEEISLLDSDDEDFPCSQFDVTNVDDFPDLTNSLQSMFGEDDLDNPECSSDLHCEEESWFKSSKGNLLIDLPMMQPQKYKDEINEKNFTLDIQKNSRKLEQIDDATKRQSHKRSLCKDDPDIVLKPSKRKDLSNWASKPCTSNELSEQKPACKATIHDLIPENYLPLVLIPPVDVKKHKSSLEGERKKKSCETLEDDDIFRLKKKRKKEKHRSHKGTTTSSGLERKGATKIDSAEIKKYRNEKLKDLVKADQRKEESNVTGIKLESSSRDVVVKLTKENRSDKMYMGCDEKNVAMYTEVEVAPDYEDRRKELHGFDESLYDDALDLCSQVPVEPIQSTARDDTPAGQHREKEVNQVNTTKVEYPPKRIAHTMKKMDSSSARENVSHLPTEGKEVNQVNTTKVEYPPKIIAHTLKKVDSSSEERSLISNLLTEEKSEKQSLFKDDSKKDGAGHAPMRSTTLKKNQDTKFGRPPPPVLGFYVDTLEKKEKPMKKLKKKVQFNMDNVDCQWLEIDPEERCNVTHTSSFKLKANVMKERQFELESAIALACRWRVDWLKEPQVPSKIYMKTLYNSELPIMKLWEYKENLKEVMFYHLWNAVSLSHNRPNLDYLPSTQCLNDGKKGIYSLWIESMDKSWTPPHLRTITAYRNVDEDTVIDELTGGLMVVLNLRVKEAAGVSCSSRANIFAYIASAHQILNIGGVKRQKLIFKIFQGNFEIMMGEMKVKVLTYTRLLLRRFESFAMMEKSPIISFLICQQEESSVPSIFPDTKNFVDVFLDSSQKCAITRCINSIKTIQPCINLIDGSPGTGKTQVIVSLMREIFSMEKRKPFSVKPKVLIITRNDNLSDDLVQRLEKVSVPVSMNVMRYGRSKLMNHRIKYCCVEDRIRTLIEEDTHNELVDLEEEKRSVLAKKNSFELILECKSLLEEKKINARMRLAALENEYADLLTPDSSKTKDQLLRKAAKNKAFEDADVVVTSIHECWTSNSRFDEDFAFSEQNIDDVSKFTVCIFDDANYMDEVQMLIPILLMVPKLILVGDSGNEFHFKKGDQSPFCRLVRDFNNRSPAAISHLKSQHRIPPSIFKWLDDCYGLPCQPKQVKPSRLIPFLVVHLQIENSADVDYKIKLKKQAKFCYQLALKTKEIEKDMPVAIIVASQAEKKILQEIIPFSVSERATMYLCTWDDIIGRDYDVVIACIPMKRRSIDSWLYIASSRARHSLFMCSYFEDDSKDAESIQWSKAESQLLEKSIKWNVDNDFPKDSLRSRPNTG